MKFFAWLHDDYISQPGGVASRGQIKLGAKSRLNIHTNLSALWTWAVASGYAEKNIVRTIPAPDVEETDIDPLTTAEVAGLLKACDTARTYEWRQIKVVTRGRSTATRDRMVSMLLFDTGLRAQELCDLIIDDLNLSQKDQGAAWQGRQTTHRPLWQAHRQSHLGISQGPTGHSQTIRAVSPRR